MDDARDSHRVTGAHAPPRGLSLVADAGDEVSLEQTTDRIARASLDASGAKTDSVAEPDPGADTGSRADPSLDRVLELALSFQRSSSGAELAERIASAFSQCFGFSGVVLRLLDSRSGFFELRSSIGLGSRSLGQARGQEIDLEDLGAFSTEGRRLGRSYCFPNSDEEWGEDHRLVVPLIGEERNLIGFVQLEGHQDASGPDEVTVRMAEHLADQAALALAHVSLRDELEAKGRELGVAGERVRELEKLKTNFIAAVSHELRTPLTSIRAYSEAMLNDLERIDHTTLGEFLDIIHGESERLSERIEDVLEMSRHEKGTGRLRVDIELAELLADASSKLEPLAKERGITIQIESGSSCDPLSGDRAAVEQLVLELLENAIKFSQRGGCVQVRSRGTDTGLELVVEDAGDGIPEDESSRIFDRFYQVDGSMTRGVGGQGLGLALCRDIVNEHGGNIWVEAVPDGGSRFVVHLPRRRSVVRPSDERGLDIRVHDELLEFLDLAVVLVSELMGTRIASIMVGDEHGESLRIEAAVGLEEEVVRHTRVSRGQGIAGKVWNEANTMLMPDIRDDERFEGDINDKQYESFSLLSCPLRLHGQVIGVLNVNNKLDGSIFGDDDRLLLEALADRISRAYESFEAFQRGHRRLSRSRTTMRAALELTRDRRTDLREIVAVCGLEAGRQLEMTEIELRGLAYALRVYDMGLTAVSEQILRKTTPLTAEDRSRVEDHVHMGAELCSVLEETPQIEHVLYHHHENVDGSGYPDGLEGETIPLGARVVRLVDAFSAMLHGRPGRPPLALDEARELVEEAVGRRFCGRVVPAFLDAVEGRREEILRLCSSPPVRG